MPNKRQRKKNLKNYGQETKGTNRRNRKAPRNEAFEAYKQSIVDDYADAFLGDLCEKTSTTEPQQRPILTE